MRCWCNRCIQNLPHRHSSTPSSWGKAITSVHSAVFIQYPVVLIIKFLWIVLCFCHIVSPLTVTRATVRRNCKTKGIWISTNADKRDSIETQSPFDTQSIWKLHPYRYSCRLVGKVLYLSFFVFGVCEQSATALLPTIETSPWIREQKYWWTRKALGTGELDRSKDPWTNGNLAWWKTLVQVTGEWRRLVNEDL